MKPKFRDLEGQRDLTAPHYITVYGLDKMTSNKRLNIRRWKVIIPQPNNSIEVIVRDQYLLVENYDVNKFIKEVDTPVYKDIEFWETSKLTILCKKCFGRGVLSFVDKAVVRPNFFNIADTNTFNRRPNGVIKIFENINSGNKVFVSTPVKPKGYESCEDCFGSGLGGINHKYYKFVKLWRGE